MKKVFVLALLPLLFLGCVKSNNGTQTCTDVTPAAEEAQIIAYCTANGITYTKDPSGIYYQILNLGTAPHPTTSSKVTVDYTGKLLNGTIVDKNTTPYTNYLNQLIQAWQIAVPLIGVGGHIVMVAPSSLCYGCYGASPNVAPNTILYFDITLNKVE